MDKKQMYVQVINLNTGKVFSLPTLYTDRTEACVRGQNYIRDRQAENIIEVLFFRVLNAEENGEIAPEYCLWGNQLEEEENDFDWENPACQSSHKNEDEDEEPEHGESVYGNAEEPSSSYLTEEQAEKLANFLLGLN